MGKNGRTKIGKNSRFKKKGKAKGKGKVMDGIIKDGKNYIAQRYFCLLGIQARKRKNLRDAQASLTAIDNVQAIVQSRINKKLMAGSESTLEDFMTYVKAAVTEMKKAFPGLGVESWRYYSENHLKYPGFTKSSLRSLRKNPQISFGDSRVRVLQGTMENTLPGWLTLSKAAGLNSLGDIQGIEGLEARRRAANDFAKQELASLKKGDLPSDAVVLKALRLWGFQESTSRPNVLPEGRDWVYSDTLGIIEARKDHAMTVTSACTGHVHFIRLISSWARRRSPNREVPFTTISLNKNYAGRLHRDGGNIGPSIGLAIGLFTGGKLRYWAADSQRGKRSKNVEQVRDEPSIALNTKRGAVFDGNCAHEVEPFEGERYSLIFFTVKKYKEACLSVKRKIVSMGADWPTDASLKALQAKVPRLSAR